MEYQNAFSSLSNEVFYGSAIQKGIVESYKELLIKEVKKLMDKNGLYAKMYNTQANYYV